MQVGHRPRRAFDRDLVAYYARNPQLLRAPAGRLPKAIIPPISFPTLLFHVQKSPQHPLWEGDKERLSVLYDRFWPVSQVMRRRTHRSRMVKDIGKGIGFSPPKLRESEVCNSDFEEYGWEEEKEAPGASHVEQPEADVRGEGSADKQDGQADAPADVDDDDRVVYVETVPPFRFGETVVIATSWRG